MFSFSFLLDDIIDNRSNKSRSCSWFLLLLPSYKCFFFFFFVENEHAIRECEMRACENNQNLLRTLFWKVTVGATFNHRFRPFPKCLWNIWLWIIYKYFFPLFSCLAFLSTQFRMIDLYTWDCNPPTPSYCNVYNNFCPINNHTSWPTKEWL